MLHPLPTSTPAISPLTFGVWHLGGPGLFAQQSSWSALAEVPQRSGEAVGLAHDVSGKKNGSHAKL